MDRKYLMIAAIVCFIFCLTVVAIGHYTTERTEIPRFETKGDF